MNENNKDDKGRVKDMEEENEEGWRMERKDMT